MSNESPILFYTGRTRQSVRGGARTFSTWKTRDRIGGVSFSSASPLPVSRQVHRRSRGPVIMNDAICVRDITREPLAATTCISGSRCVTRLIKIPRDLLRRALAARSRRGGRERERRVRGGEKKQRERERESDEWTHAEEKRVGGRESARATHSAAALSSTHVVSTQFAMKYRGYHRHARTIITGCPHLAGCCTQLPLSRSSISFSPSLPLTLSRPSCASSGDVVERVVKRSEIYRGRFPRHNGPKTRFNWVSRFRAHPLGDV